MRKELGHPIIDRLVVNKGAYEYFSRLVGEAPTDNQEFLNWMWTKQENCNGCFLSESRNKVVKWDGLASADIMVVLESPGFNEDLSGIPLTGIMEVRSSLCGDCTKVLDCYKTRFLKRSTDFWGKGKREHVVCKPNILPGKVTIPNDTYMKTTGTIVDSILLRDYKFAFPRNCWKERYEANNTNTLPVSPWFFTNVVSCRSYNKNTLKDETPVGVSVTACNPWFWGQWAAVQPKLVIALGTPALNKFINTKSRKVEINKIVQSNYGPVIHNKHPASMMREPESEIKAHLFSRLALTLAIALQYTGKIKDDYLENWN